MSVARCALVAAALIGCTASIMPDFASLHELQRAKHAGKPIFVSLLLATKPGRSGKSSAHMQFFNTSNKIYKYVDTDVEPYNRVGDLVRLQGQPETRLRFTGPLNSQRTPGTTVWPGVWDDATITCLKIKRITISHMDGTALVIEGPALYSVLARRLASKCPVA